MITNKQKKVLTLLSSVCMLGAAVCAGLCSAYHFGKGDCCPKEATIVFAGLGLIIFCVANFAKVKKDDDKNEQ